MKINKRVEDFFSVLEKSNCGWLRDFLWKRFNGQPVSLKIEEKAYNFFLANSVITAATAANKGGSVTTEFFYEGLEKPSVIDSYILNSLSGQAVKLRLSAIKEKLYELIGARQNVFIGNFGSGPGRDTIDILSGKYLGFPDIKAICIDKDGKALERGRVMAANRGISHRMDFIEDDFFRYKSEKKFDIILMIGIFCPLQSEACEVFLKKIPRNKLLKKDGLLLVSNSTPRMVEEDPFTCFLMKWTAGWELIYKDEHQLQSIFERAGYEWRGYFKDKLGFHVIGMGIFRDEFEEGEINR